MKVFRFCVAVAFVVALTDVPALADRGAGKPNGCGETCCGSCEPTVLCCRAEAKTVKVRKQCYEVECEYVCIPPVSLPTCSLFGGDNCAARNRCDSPCGGCGTEGCESCSQRDSEPGLLRRFCSLFTDCRIRKVRKLKKKESEVERCVCEWSVMCMQSPGCGKCSYDGCCAPASACAPCAE